MERMSIGKLAERSGVPASTVRYYEQIGMLPKAERENGQRRYDESILENLALIRLSKRVGFNLNEIQEMLHAGVEMESVRGAWRKNSPAKIQEIDSQIAQLEAAKRLFEVYTGCNCVSLAACEAVVC